MCARVVTSSLLEAPLGLSKNYGNVGGSTTFTGMHRWRLLFYLEQFPKRLVTGNALFDLEFIRDDRKKSGEAQQSHIVNNQPVTKLITYVEEYVEMKRKCLSGSVWFLKEPSKVHRVRSTEHLLSNKWQHVDVQMRHWENTRSFQSHG